VSPKILSREPPDGNPGLLPGVDPLVARLYANRGITRSEEIDHGLSNLLNPAGLGDFDKATTRLAAAVETGERILIVGDFDADGATSVAMCVSLLKAMGAAEVEFLVPNRFEFGYGLSPEIVRVALAREPAVIVTVDNGISSIEGVALANAHGTDVIITDHHLPGVDLPDAYAIVNPNAPDCAFESKALAGVGVAYYVLSGVRASLRGSGWFTRVGLTEPNMADWLDLVALGTVADVVPLDRNNRVLVHHGLARMRRGRCRPGIRALVESSGRNLGELDSEDLGFSVGPRLNAAGRLDDMTLGIRCLLAASPDEARRCAAALNELNKARRELEAAMVEDARLIVAGHDEPVGGRYGVTLYDASWHQGIIGIVAGRLRDKVNRPVIAFADAGHSAPDELKGSARSLSELHIRDALDVIATRHPGLLLKFGGHAMAAGLSIKRVHYQRFARAFDTVVRERLPESALTQTIETDGELEAGDLTLVNAQTVRDAGPWGQGFPPPLFHGRFDLVSQRVVGGQHLKMAVKSGGRLFDAIAFRQAPLGAPGEVGEVQLVYKLGINTYRGGQTLQLMVEYVRSIA